MGIYGKEDKGISKETLSTGNFDVMHYSDNLNKQIEFINNKISEAEVKITALKSKESIISGIIDRTNSSVGKFLDEHNFAKAQGLQNALITQFETYSLMQDMILKYEAGIRAYVKMCVDIENHKVNSFAKLKASQKNDGKDEGQYHSLMTKINELLAGDQKGPAALKNQVKKELELEGY